MVGRKGTRGKLQKGHKSRCNQNKKFLYGTGCKELTELGAEDFVANLKKIIITFFFSPTQSKSAKFFRRRSHDLMEEIDVPTINIIHPEA